MKVYQAIALALEAEGCDTIFGLMGDGNMWLWAELAESGKAVFHSARHENAAVNMADGYARATGKVGVATVTHGPGLSQVSTALMTANRNRTPLVLVVGEYSLSGNRLQWFDQRAFALASGAKFVTLTHKTHVARDVAEAFYTARSQNCPVVLNLPIDIQEETLEAPWSYRPSSDFLPAIDATPSDDALLPLVDALARAERPLIVAGRGARVSGARAEIIELAERLGALLTTSLFTKDWFDGHRLNAGLAGGYCAAPTEHLMKQSDFVLAVGAQLGEFTTKGGTLIPNAKVARIDVKPAFEEIGQTPGSYVRGDARETISRINRMLEERQVRRTGYAGPETEAALRKEPPAGPRPKAGLDARNVMRHLSGHLPPRVQFTQGCGNFMATTIPYITLPTDSEFYCPVQFGAIGQSLSLAIGAAIGGPDRPHVLNDGDGSILMCMQELETVARLGIQMVVIISNDGGYGAEIHKLAARDYDPLLAQWPSPDFVGIARALGGDGVRLTKEDDIRDAVKAGLKKGGLYIVDIPLPADSVSDALNRGLHGGENVTPLFRNLDAPAVAAE